MKTEILLFFTFLATLRGQCLSKLNSIHINNSKAGYALFLILNSTAACVFFLISGGFRLRLTIITVLFSLCYAVVIFASLIFNLKALQLTKICNVYVSSNACNLIVVSVLGFLAFGEDFSISKVIRIIIMLAAVFFVFSGQRNKDANHSEFSAVLIFIVIATISNFVVLKLYALTGDTAGDNSFFFSSNVVLILGAVGWFLKELLTKHISIAESKNFIKPITILPFIFNTFCGNINSLISLDLISKIDASLYTPVTTAIGILCSFTASLIFREKNNVYSYVAAILAMIAVII